MPHYNALYNFRFAALKGKNVNLFATRAFASWLRSNIRVSPTKMIKKRMISIIGFGIFTIPFKNYTTEVGDGTRFIKVFFNITVPLLIL